MFPSLRALCALIMCIGVFNAAFADTTSVSTPPAESIASPDSAHTGGSPPTMLDDIRSLGIDELIPYTTTDSVPAIKSTTKLLKTSPDTAKQDGRITRFMKGFHRLVLRSASTTNPAAKDSLVARFRSSFAVRNPSAKTRMVDADTVGNPFDYDVMPGLTGTYGNVAFYMTSQYRRQNGLYYVNQEYGIDRRVPAYSIGTKLRKWEGAPAGYLFSSNAQANLFGWVGVGVTRQYTQEWMSNGATMARFSLANNSHKILGVNTYIATSLDLNPTASTFFFKFTIRNLTRGRLSLVPYISYLRIKTEGRPATTSYEANVALEISI
jgi:hypothetical protein